MKKTILLLAVFAFAMLNGTGQNTGINTTTPQAYLDINGDLALRMGVINLPNAANADVNTTTNRKSVYRITNSSPLGATISGLTGGVDGRTITFINTSTSPLGIVSDGTGNVSVAANRILTSDGNTLYIKANGAATLLYDGTASRWRVISLSKPDPYTPPTLWFMDDSSNIYNLNNGKVGIGTVAPTNKLTVNGNADVTGKMGIGNANPQAKLDVVGNVKIADGTQGAGKVLTSDANGTASWQTASTVPNGGVGYGSWGDCSVNNISEFNPVYNPVLGQFGATAVDMEGNYAIVGAEYDTVGSIASGACYLYFFNGTTWVLTRQIPSPDPSVGDHFGSAVAISGDNIIIGAYGDDGTYSNQGAAYIYKISTNVILKLPTFSGNITDGNFGKSVFISGNVVVIGCPNQTVISGGTYTQAGVVFIYNINTNTVTQIDNPSPANQDHFGASVGISGSMAVIGCPDADVSGSSDCGRVYAYNISSATIFSYTYTTLFNNAHYGSNVSINGNYILSGWGRSIGSGTVDVLTLNGNTFTTKQSLNFTPYGTTSNNEGFGSSLKMSGNYAIVGARNDDATKGSASIFQNTGGYWMQLQKFRNPAPSNNNQFGLFTSIDGTSKRFVVLDFTPVAFFGKVNN